jgi:hypothetical protein
MTAVSAATTFTMPARDVAVTAVLDTNILICSKSVLRFPDYACPTSLFAL